MSWNAAVGSMAAGACVAVYGGFKYVTAGDKTAAEAATQKKLALGYMAAGVAAAAVGAGWLYSGAATGEVSLLPYMPSSIKEIDVVASASIKQSAGICPIEEFVRSCPIDQLHVLREGATSLSAKTFKVLEETVGISCENFLPWRSEFHRGGTGYIDGIHATHLEKPVMWGIDQWKRPFMAIKYTCNATIEGAMAIFQRYSDSEHTMVPGGHFMARGCEYLGSLDPLYRDTSEFLGSLQTFLSGKNVTVLFGRDGIKNVLALSKSL